jgi:hypothetical protein
VALTARHLVEREEELAAIVGLRDAPDQFQAPPYYRARPASQDSARHQSLKAGDDEKWPTRD